jgi:hypothetical protein
MTSETNTKQLPANLCQFSGSTQFYRHPFGVIFTEGIHYLAEECGAFWLIDVVASYQSQLCSEAFQLWRIERDARNESGCVVTCRSDTNEPDLVKQRIPYTDFPLDQPFEFYAVCNGDQPVVMLKSEY